MKSALFAITFVPLALAAPAAIAQSQDHSHHQHTTTPTASEIAALASVKAYAAANERMHKDMSITFSGDADADFVRGMIPHHQGAVDMAKVLLAHGKDPALRRLANNIIRSQNAEIAMMKAWLKKLEARTAKAPAAK